MDLAQHLTGSRIVGVMADLGTLFPIRQRPTGEIETFQRADDVARTPVAIDTEDFASVLVRFENGARGSFTVSQVSAGRKNRLSVEIDGGSGALAWCSEESELLWRGSRTGPGQTFQRNPGQARLPGLSRLPAGHAEGWPDALANVIRGFYEQVQGAECRPWVASLEDGADGMRLVEAILASSRTERWVHLSPHAGRGGDTSRCHGSIGERPGLT
jgi:predicted dehydrogenase